MEFTQVLTAILWGMFAAASLLIGYFLSKRDLSNRAIGLIMGLGAGALIGAIAYELVPVTNLGEWGIAVSFGSGAITFYIADKLVDERGGEDRKDIAGDQKGGSGRAIYIGTLLDNIPESIILGMSLAIGGAINLAFLVAVFVSNLPEGVAGSLNLHSQGYSQNKILRMWLTLILVSGLCAGLGFIINHLLPEVDGHIAQAFAAGAMLTMLADAMMPEAYEHGGKLVGLVTVFGFLLSGILSVLQ